MVEEETNFTTVAISNKTRDRLETRKVHPRQPVDEVIEELLNLTEQPR